MRGDKRLGKAIALIAVLLALWITLWVGVVWRVLEPAHREIASSLAGVVLPMLVLSWLFAVIGIGAGMRAGFGEHLRGPARLLERTRVLLAQGRGATPGTSSGTSSGTGAGEPIVGAGIALTTDDDHKPANASIRGTRELRALARAIESLAAQRDALERDIERQVEKASRGVQLERNRFAALMAELAQSVVACNLDGRILLYNPRARQEFRPHSQAPELADGAELIGIGRPIDALIDRERIAHGLATIRSRIARREPDPSTEFITATPSGQLLRVQMAPVRTTGRADEALAGFLLVLENVTTRFDEAARRDQLLLQTTEEGRATLATVRSAIERIGAPGDSSASADDPRSQEARRHYAIALDGIASLGVRIEALAASTTEAIRERWPLERIEVDDLLANVARRISKHVDCRVDIEPASGDTWLEVDSFGVGQAMAWLVRRLVDEFDVRAVRLALAQTAEAEVGTAPHAGHAHLDLIFAGRALSTETAMAWELEPMRLEGDTSPLSVRDIVSRHGGQFGLLRDRARHEARLRITLPLAADPGERAPLPAPSDSRPEYFDFDLFDAVLQGGELDQRALSSLAYTVFDTETTGLSPAQGDQIIQIGAARIVNGKILYQEAFEQLIDPQRTIPPASIPIHGITPDMVAGMPVIASVLPAFHRFAEESVLVAHNAAFDLRFLQMQEAATGIKFHQPVLDTLLLSALVHPNQASHRLDDIAERFAIRVVGRHTALGDALVTAQVLLRLIPLLEAMGIRTLGEAREASQKTWYARLSY